MAKIFISYRREDSEYQTDRLHAELSKYVEFPERDIFIDVDNIPLGVDFVDYLDRKVSECETLVAVIGKQWLEATDPRTGQRRLDDPNDFVRIEIATALKRGIPVVPLLLDGTDIPGADRLPEDLQALARKNGTRIDRRSFGGDVRALIEGLPISLKSDATDAITPPPAEPEPERHSERSEQDAEPEIDWRAEARLGELDPHGRKFSDVIIVYSEGDEEEAYSIFQMLAAKVYSVTTFPIGIDPDYDNQAWFSVPEAKLVIVIWSPRALQNNRSTMSAIAEKAQRKLISACSNSLPWESVPEAFQNGMVGADELHIIEDLVREDLEA